MNFNFWKSLPNLPTKLHSNSLIELSSNTLYSFGGIKRETDDKLIDCIYNLNLSQLEIGWVLLDVKINEPVADVGLL